MRIVYIISAYKLPEQLTRLVSYLHSGAAGIVIHIDRKTGSQIYAQAVRDLRRLPGVFFLKRYPCEWGGFGHVQASLEGIAEIFRRDIAFDYAVLLTGQDYPIKTNQQIHCFFEQNKGKLFIEHFSLPSDEWEGGGLQRVEQWHMRFRNRRLTFPNGRFRRFKRRFLRGFQPFGGSSYWCLPRESIAYIHHFRLENPGFVRFFRWVDVPDELFFQTILLNSPYSDSVVDDNLRYIDWKDPHSGSPAVLGVEDFDEMLNSPKLFARKFDLQVDSQVLDMIDQRILGYAAD